MATRKTTRRKTKQTSPLQMLADALIRPGTIGALLVIVSIFTVLSFLSGTRGSVTGAWIGALRDWFGWGAFLVPVVSGIFGVWLVLNAMDQRATLPWRKPIGALLAFLATITGMSLFFSPATRANLVQEGSAGGALGTEIATVLEQTITSFGAWALIAFVAIAALIFIGDRWLIDNTIVLLGGLRGVWATRRVIAPAHGTINPQIPLPLGEISFWKRWRARLGMHKPAASGDPFDLSTFTRPASTLVRPDGTDAPTAPARQTLVAPTPGNKLQAPAAATAAPQPLSAQALAPQAQPAAVQPGLDLPQPRIFGGAQEWRLPPMDDMLKDWERRTDSDETIRKQGKLIQETLALFGVPADFEGAYKGPSVTQYLIKPGYVERNIKGEAQRIKVKVAKIAGLSNDLALALAAPSVRIEAPIPGTTYVGIEVPNHESNVVGLKELMESESFINMKARLKIALGEDVKGQSVSADLARMPHLLIAGATGSGKSVCINSIITCLLLTHTPDTLRLLMVDPKMVELSVYNGVPHLLSPVVTEVDKAAGVLFWAVKEMERRYNLFSKAGARDITRYNEYLVKRGEKALPFIVIIVDEMADLMMAAPEEVEKHICRLAQMARATGMHLIIATQRPSVDVITGLIKANFPARIAFAVTSGIDSRVILDIPGAERLLGRGDMLFMAPDASKLERLQGTYLSDDEINGVVRYWKGVRVLEPASAPAPWEEDDLWDAPSSAQTMNAALPMRAAPLRAPANPVARSAASSGGAGAQPPFPPTHRTGSGGALVSEQKPLFEQIEQMKAIEGRDELFDDARKIVHEQGKGSVSLLQRKLRIGYGRAARLVEQLEEAGILGPDQGGTAGRPVLDAAKPSSAASSPPPTRPAGAPTPAPRIIGGEEDESSSPKPGVWM